MTDLWKAIEVVAASAKILKFTSSVNSRIVNIKCFVVIEIIRSILGFHCIISSNKDI